MRALGHAAAGRYRSGRNQVQAGRSLGNFVAEDPGDPFLDADCSGSLAKRPQTGGDLLVGTLVFVPGEHLGIFERTAAQLFAGSILFKGRAHAEGVAAGRDDSGKQTFAVAPTHSSEIKKRGAAGDENGIDLVLGHELLSARDPRLAFFDCNRLYFTAHGLQGRDRGWKRACVLALLCLQRGTAQHGQQAGACDGL